MAIYTHHYSDFLTLPLADFYSDYTPTLGGTSHESPPAADWLAALLVGSLSHRNSSPQVS